jgi:putative membrane protein
MNHDSYIHLKREELTPRDYLAADGTILANERILMAYIRTSVALAAAGGSLIHFLGSLATTIGDGLLLVLAVGILGAGLQRFIRYKRRLRSL